SDDAQQHADRVAAETLIRTTAMAMANGAAVKDLDGLIQRNVGRISAADLRAGRLGAIVVGDIVNAVEQAKGNTNVNWLSAPPQQLSAYMLANGLSADQVRKLLGVAGNEREAGAGGPFGKASGRPDYQAMSYSTAQSLNSVTQSNFGATPFAGAGINYG